MCFDAAHIPIDFDIYPYSPKLTINSIFSQSINGPSLVSGNEIVTAYGNFGCKGRLLTFTIDYQESRCNYCWDSCYAAFDDGTPAHTNVMSVNIPEGVVALAYNTCLGSFGYSDPGFQGVLEPGCHDVGSQGISHFASAEESTTTPGKYELLG